MRLLPLSAFPLLAFLGLLLDLGQARQGNKPRDKLQLRAKPRAQEVSTDIYVHFHFSLGLFPGSVSVLLPIAANSQLTTQLSEK